MLPKISSIVSIFGIVYSGEPLFILKKKKKCVPLFSRYFCCYHWVHLVGRSGREMVERYKVCLQPLGDLLS